MIKDAVVPAITAAVVGGGFISEVHSKASRASGATVLGVASSTEVSARAARDRMGLEVAFASYDDLLADDRVDVVHICTPNESHEELALKAFAAGKHVICEKPLATSLEGARKMAAAAAKAGLLAAVPFVYRFHPMVREARARIASGKVGRLFTIRGAYLQDWFFSSTSDDWRVDADQGGPSRAFADIGSHLCDLIEFVSGERIERLVAATRTVHPTRSSNILVMTEDAVTVLFETATGTVGSLLISQVALGNKNKLAIELSGSEETIEFDQEAPDFLRIGRLEGFASVSRSADRLSPDAARLSVVPSGHPMGYQDAFNAFVLDAYRAARGHAVEGLPTFDDGLRAAQLTEAVLDSSRSLQWIDLSSQSIPAGIA